MTGPMSPVVCPDAIGQGLVMTSEPQPDLEAQLRRAESGLRRALVVALAGGIAERRRLMAAVQRCRLARLAARGSWTYARREALEAAQPTDEASHWMYDETIAGTGHSGGR
jgi:hypothetical protein